MVLQSIMMHNFLVEPDSVLRMQPLILACSRVHIFYWWFSFMWPFAFSLSANPNKNTQPKVQIFLLYYFNGLVKQIYWNNSCRFKLVSGSSLSPSLLTPIHHNLKSSCIVSAGQPGEERLCTLSDQNNVHFILYLISTHPKSIPQKILSCYIGQYWWH